MSLIFYLTEQNGKLKRKRLKNKRANFYEILILFSSLDIEYSFYGTSKDNIKKQ